MKLKPCVPKHLGVSVIKLTALICLLAASVASAQSVDDLEGFELVAENEFLALYLNEKTVEFAVVHLESGRVWRSNPYDRDRRETVAGGSNKRMLNSQLTITYYAANRQLQMDSYNDAIAHDQYQIHRIPGGFRIDYQLGRRWQDSHYLPLIISEERFNDLILSRIPNARDQRFLRELYILFELEEGYVDTDSFSILGVDLDALLGDYGLKVHDQLRASDKRRLFQEYLVMVRDANGYLGLGDVTPEDISGLFGTRALMLRWNAREWDKEDAIELIKQAGYTPEDAVVDHEQFGVAPPYPDLRNFAISVEYVLDGDSFVARIPGDRIEYPHRVIDPATGEEVSYPLANISLLNYFGAAYTDSHGYILVPDGSGALIYTNNGKTGATLYNRRVYGTDYAQQPLPEFTTVELGQIHLPVFGLKDNDQAFLAVIEKGDAMARIEAAVAGMRDSYNKVWASFDFIPQVRVYMEAEGELIHLRQLSLNMYQARPYQGDMTVRYHFLTGNDANYSGMARRYQEYLVEKHGLSRLDPGQEMPLILDVVGGIDRIRPVFGVPSNVVEPLTTYSQAEAIIQDLKDAGVDALQVRFLGWLRGGMNHIFPDRVRLESKIGSQNELTRLGATLAAAGVGFYPSVDFTVVHRDRAVDGFVSFLHASRFLNRNQAFVNTHNLATLQPDPARRRPLVSPREYDRMVGGFIQDYSRLGIGGLALGDLGRRLVSDFRLDLNKLVDRQQALEIVVQQMQRMKELGLNLVIDGANAYALPYASYVVNAPWYSRGAPIIDEAIPFYQMVVSGYIGYASPAANLLPQDRQRYFLKLLESGSLPAFAVAHAEGSMVKKSSFDHLYSLSYEANRGDILSLYHEVQGILGGLWRERIVEHSCIQKTVCTTTYENGTRMVVNYGDESVEIDGVTVPPMGYARFDSREGR